MAPSRLRLKVAIIGGGIGGLSLAVGLIKQPHLDVHIYESVAGYKDVGAGLSLHMNALKAMDLIDPRIKQVYFERALSVAEETDEEITTPVSIAWGSNSGALIAELGKAKGRKTIARADLLEGLRSLIPSHRLHFKKRVSKISERHDQSVDITFKDGTTKRADCVIGCDGAHSTVRSYLLGADHPATDPKNHDGWQMFRTLLPTTEACKHIKEDFTRKVVILCGPHGHINCMPLQQGRKISAGVAIRNYHDQKQTVAAAPPTLNPDNFVSYTPESQAIIKLINLDTSFSWRILDHDHAPFYSRRRVAMMGDAAHTCLPFAGQGAAQALEDAAVLSALFKQLRPPGVATPPSSRRRSSASSEDSASSFFGAEDEEPVDQDQSTLSLLPSLFAAYDAIRRPRSQKVVDISRDFGKLYAFALPQVGDDPETMREFMKARGSWTNDWDQERQNTDAVKRFWELVEMEKGGWGLSGKPAEHLATGMNVVDKEVTGHGIASAMRQMVLA